MKLITENAGVDDLSDQELINQGYRRANRIIVQMIEELAPEAYKLLRFYPPVDARTFSHSEYEVARRSIFERDDYTCIYCGKSMDKDGNLVLHVDHIKPFSLGGLDLAMNLVTACERCNLVKGSKPLLSKNFKWVTEEVRRRNKLLGISDTKLFSILTINRGANRESKSWNS